MHDEAFTRGQWRHNSVSRLWRDSPIYSHLAGRPNIRQQCALRQGLVADFVFTTCPGACLLEYGRRGCVRCNSQRRACSDASGLLHCWPARDTPKQLSQYAKAHHVKSQDWYFLTGPRQELDDLGFDAFKLNHVDEAIQHSTFFILTDKNSRIGGRSEVTLLRFCRRTRLLPCCAEKMG